MRRQLQACSQTRQRGAAAVEFVIIAGVFLTTLLACFEFTRLMMVRAVFEHSLAETVRIVKVKPAGTNFTAAFNETWQAQAQNWAWLKADADLEITNGFYDQTATLASDLKAGNVGGSQSGSQALAVYDIRYTAASLTLGNLLPEVVFQQRLLVQHEQ
ncbi:Uncharacterised protein [BD1-7 clade bacterium]|uniref:TadE-like domain-containing protein n=1 Tax=BD1-7 clade bacterium TaxID=2029982 RepID=A0A5S9N7C5_9GAMM|nr:Uncharacterised protein [BD1-7 clade bacterium]